MREWNLRIGDPLSFILAADARLGKTDYTNDQIWELALGGGEPPAIALQTTFGLRARGLRLFPRFTEGDVSLNDPVSFVTTPAIHHFYPNYVDFSCEPFPGIKIIAEYWVPGSQAIIGRFSFQNQSSVVRNLRFEWIALLIPDANGQRMAPAEMDAAATLVGASGGLAPVVFLTGGPQAGSGSYPSLLLSLVLEPGVTRQVTWVQAAYATADASFDAARSLAGRNLDAEFARIHMLNATQLDILTGDQDWDAALALSQKNALGLFIHPDDQLPEATFVVNRQPDQGFSLRGDGRDYNHLWSGQTPFDAYYLAFNLLPAYPELARGVLRNFLSTQIETGFIDCKPGPAAQRSNILAAPLLVELAWRIYQHTEEHLFLEEIFPALLAFIQVWFSPTQDRDGDGIPEWSHCIQTGFEDHPLFAYWQSWAQGVDITTAESPALCALLYKECQTLIKIARLIEKTDFIPQLQALAENLRTAVEISWNASESSYLYWDRDTHYCTNFENLGEQFGDGDIPIHRSFDQPVRLLVRIKAAGDILPKIQVFIHGVGPSGQHMVEHIQSGSFQWYLNSSSVTGERVYSSLEVVQVNGLGINDQVSLLTAGYRYLDHTTLLPLWAGIPAKERAQSIIERTITNPERFWKTYGIPACYDSNPDDINSLCQSVHLTWNAMICEGLLAYGYRREAADLVTHLLSVIISSLKRDKTFYRRYHAETGHGLGERNALDGLVPVGLFLDVLGVKVISPDKIILRGSNPFPWPVTVKYQGLNVLRQSEKTTILFPNGQSITLENEERSRIITLK